MLMLSICYALSTGFYICCLCICFITNVFCLIVWLVVCFFAQVYLTDGTVINVAVPPKDALMRATELVDLLCPMAELTDEEGDHFGLFETTAFVVLNSFLSGIIHDTHAALSLSLYDSMNNFT